ncbi:hypothetical protein [Lysinibacillus pakistanensis]|uniref:Uncharacterized protein n=1 Tax=Lysinibacillus pakistanensis TaxID=759811 RepID=A0ABX6DD38_9BACI|nr:hypothetical protein GDS87_16360 [Lysinibacillus pakistanensis]
MRNIITGTLSIIIGLALGFLFFDKNQAPSNQYTLILIFIVAILVLIPIYRKFYMEWKDEKEKF